MKILGTEGGKPKAAHRPPERKRLLPGIVFQQNWSEADIRAARRHVRFTKALSRMSAKGQQQTFRSAIACPSLSVLTSYSLFGD
jgi:hypothetical protein